MRSNGTGRWPAVRHAAETTWPIVQQTAAAAIAWALAVWVLHRDSPFFAPIAAVIGLNATLGRRGSNAVRLLVGVLLGITVGEVAVTVAGGGIWTLTVATFVAMVLANLLDGARIVVAQAAISAILVTAFGDTAEGVDRLVEALIGGGVALLFSQVVFSPEPLRLLRRAEGDVLARVARALHLTAQALEHDDPEAADQALATVRGLRDRLSDLATMRKASDRIVRHSVTWRSRKGPVVQERESAEQLDLLAASCVVLTRTAMATPPDRRSTLAPAVRELGRAIDELAGEPGDRATRQRAAERALDLARWATEHAGSVAIQSATAGADAAVRMLALDVMVFAGVEPAQAREALEAVVAEVRIADRPENPRPPPRSRPTWPYPRWPRHRRAVTPHHSEERPGALGPGREGPAQPAG
jgi:hypothetical protein